MKVKIGSVFIPDATVKRFIDLQSGLALSMIQVSYTDERVDDGELVEAFNNNTLLPFECEILKTNVLVHGLSHEAKKHEYTLQERGADVSCGYMLLHTKVGNERAIIVPENVKKQVLLDTAKLRTFPFIRFILEKDIPKEWFE